MEYQIQKEQQVFDDFLKIFKAQVSHERFDGKGSISADRLALDRGNSVGVLLYEKDTDSFLFVKQFRYPSARHGEPWLLEIPAGHVDQGEDPKATAIREVREEIGYEIKNLQPISTYFPSPGMLSEQISLFFAEVDSEDRIHQGGGQQNEKEDIQLIKISKSDCRKKLKEGFFNNSVSLISLQWYFLEQAG